MAEKNNNLSIYDRIREDPKEAKKPIQAGRMKGMSDINPMWRIKMLTAVFGPCGFGWKYEVTRMWLENGAGGTVAAFVTINLYVKQNGEWSEPIPGIGGNSFVSQEKSGPYTNDECYKMALTDAISVASKALGMAADVYYKNVTTKYSSLTQEEKNEENPEIPESLPLAIQEINAATTKETLVSIYNNYQVLHTDKRFMEALSARKKQLS